jgi:D-alanine-D-alanine ligase
MKKLRVLVLMHEALVPPDTLEGHSDEEVLEWKTEFDVLHTLRDMGHEAVPLGVSDDLGIIRKAILEDKPHLVFNLLEEFHSVAHYDQNVVSYLELMRQPYTGCNPRGLLLSHDKALCKKILAYHRIPTPRFAVFPQGRAVKPSKRLKYPLLVKSNSEDASLGISQASVVQTDEKLKERVEFIHEQVKTDALVEEFIEGRELYVGVIGNRRLQTFPVWEMLFKNWPDDVPRIATRTVKWNTKFQKKHGIDTQAAQDLSAEAVERIQRLSKRVYRALTLSGYARMDFRMSVDGRFYVLEANPNPNLSFGEDFAESAEKEGVSYEALLQRIMSLGQRYEAAWKTGS